MRPPVFVPCDGLISSEFGHTVLCGDHRPEDAAEEAGYAPPEDVVWKAGLRRASNVRFFNRDGRHFVGVHDRPGQGPGTGLALTRPPRG